MPTAGAGILSTGKVDRESRTEPRDGEPSSEDRGFDRWLNRQLHKLYDPVLGEEIPDELSRLLEEFDQRPNGNNGPSQGGKK
jgi:hypothetical protein